MWGRRKLGRGHWEGDRTILQKFGTALVYLNLDPAVFERSQWWPPCATSAQATSPLSKSKSNLALPRTLTRGPLPTVGFYQSFDKVFTRWIKFYESFHKVDYI